MLFSKAFSVLRPDDTGHGSIRANLQDEKGAIWTFPASDWQAKAILNNVGGKVFGTIRVEQFSDSSFQLTLESVAVLAKGKNENPREYRRKTNFPDLQAHLVALENNDSGVRLAPYLWGSGTGTGVSNNRHSHIKQEAA